jgi:hypothetical protein
VITIKKKHNITDDRLIDLLIKFNNVVRFSYSRRVKDKILNITELESIVKTKMQNIDCLDASWIKCAVKKSVELQTENKLYFGGKANFFKKKYNKITTLDKNMPMEMRGSSSDKGNRKGKLVNGNLIFKPYKGLEFEIKMNLSKNERNLLSIIEEESKDKKNYFNIKINNEYIWISFNEPSIYSHSFKKDRYLGIDLNPNYLALSIMDKGEKEVYKELIDLKLLNKLNKNKKQYELTQLNKRIIGLCKGYSVEFVCLEDLNIKTSNKGNGKKYNKLVNNDWNRNYFTNNLVKWLTINSIKHLFINPFYSSFIGQIKNEEDYDSIAASKEIALRGFLSKKININDYINNFLSSLVTTRWKKMLPNVNTYKDLYDYYKQKKSKNSYRFLFNDVEKQRWSCLRLWFYKSNIDLIRI